MTEINFVVSGEWAIGFNTYVIADEGSPNEVQDIEELVPADMIK